MEFEEGALVPSELLHDLLGLPHPKTLNDPDAIEKLRLTFVALWDRIQDRLLVDHLIAFSAVGAGGIYQRVPAREQVEWATDKFQRKFHTIRVKAHKRMTYVDVSRLDEDGRRERTNALAHLAQIAAVSRPREKCWRKQG